MGWTSFHHPTRPRAQELNRMVDEELENDRCRIIDRSGWLDHGRHQFVLMQHGGPGIDDAIPPRKFIIVMLADHHRGELFLKEVEESMGPSEVDCPLRIMKQLEDQPDLGELSERWRKRVLDHHRLQGPRKAVLRHLRQEYPQGERRLVLTDGRHVTYDQGKYREKRNASAYRDPGRGSLVVLKPQAIDPEATRALWTDTAD